MGKEREEKQRWNLDEEESYVLAAQAGDLRAFDRLIARYRPALIALASQIVKSRELAEDVTQESLVAAYSALPQLADPTRFSSWLASITRHRAFRVAQGERRVMSPLDDIVAAYAPSLTADVETKIQSDALKKAISELPDDLRMIVDTYYLGQWSVKDIARFLELPTTTVKWRLHTARSCLRTQLKPYIEEHHERESI